MTGDRDIFRSAKLLIDQHGRAAILFAGESALSMPAAGDEDGEEVWCRIIDAIKELGPTEKGADESQL